MNCSIQESVKNFQNDFQKKIVGNSRTVKISNNGTTISITPRAGSNTVLNSKNAYKMAEKQIAALNELSKEYMGLSGAFRPGEIVTSPDGIVSYTIRPPFNMYRELLKKQESIDKAKAKMIQDQEAEIKSIQDLKKEVVKTIPKGELRDTLVDNLDNMVQGEVNLFNYSQQVIDEVGQDAFFNDMPFPENPEEAHAENRSEKEDTLGAFFNISDDSEVIADDIKKESISNYCNHLIRYKEKLIDNLEQKKKVLLEDVGATVEHIPGYVREKYLENSKNIQDLIDKSRADIRTLKKKQEDTMIKVLQDELDEIYKDLQGNMDILDPESLLSAFANKDIYSRIELLERLIPNSLFELDKDYDDKDRTFFETEEYGDFKGRLSLAFTENPNVVKDLRHELVKIRSTLESKIEVIVLEMVKENPIFLSKMSDARGEGQKMSLDDFKKLLNAQMADIGRFESAMTTIMENDSQMEEFLARAEVAFETRTEHIANKKHAEKTQESYYKAEEAVKEKIASGEISSKLSPEETLSRMLYDKKSFGKKIIDKFSSEYGNLLGEIRDMTKAIRYTASPNEAEELYKKKIQTIALEHDVIKPHMLKTIFERVKENENMQTKLSYFDGISEEEMDAYETELRTKLGKDFDRQVDKIYKTLLNWEFTENAMLTGMFTDNHLKNIYENSPWDFAATFEQKNKDIELGLDSSLYSTYIGEDGTSKFVLNNPPLKNMFLVPKGNPETNPDHFDQEFEKNVESDQNIYNFWRDLSSYINEYSAPRLGQRYNTIARVRKDSVQILAEIKQQKDKIYTGMNVESLRNLFNFLADVFVREKFSRGGVHLYNSKGVISNFSDESIEDVNKLTKVYIAKYKYNSLKQKLSEEGIETYISEEDFFEQKRNDPEYKITKKPEETDAEFAKRSRNMEAKMAREYHKIMARSLASQEIHASFNSNILKNALAQGHMAALQRGNEKSLKVSKMLQAFMTTNNKNKGKVRARAEKRMANWIETDIKGNRKGMNKTVKRKADTGDFELDAELEENVGNIDETIEQSNRLNASLTSEKKFTSKDATTPEGRRAVNLLRQFKFYEDAQKAYLDVLNSILEGKLESPDFSFNNIEDIDGISRRVTYTTDYDEDGNINYIKKYKVKILGPDGSEKITTEPYKITKEEYQKGLGIHFTSAAARMGRDITLGGALSHIGKTFSFTSLAFSAVVGVKNRLEGKTSGNMESVRQGDEKEFRDANHFMSGYNKYRIANRNPKNYSRGQRAQFQTLDLFVEKLDVFQDKKDFVQKIMNQQDNSLFSNAFSFAIDLPERKNQLPMLIKNAAQMIVKDKDGKEHRVFENNQFGIYIPGTLKLKPEFREGPEGKRNIELWENFGSNIRVRGQANPIHDLALKTTADIINSQGNFSDMDTLPAFEHPLGALLLLFNRWFGSRANRMFISKEHLNPITGVTGGEAYMAKNRMLSSAPVLSGYAALLALQVATPGAAGIAALAGIITGTVKSFIESKARGGKARPQEEFYRETVALFTDVAARFVTFPFQYLGSSKKINIVDSDWYARNSPLEKALREDKISAVQAGRIKMASTSLATSMGISSVFLMGRLMLNSELIDYLIDNITAPDEDDDEEELKRKQSIEFLLYTMQDKLGIGIENIGNNMQTSAFGEFNFLHFLKDKTALPLLGSMQKMQREMGTFTDDGYNDNDSGFMTSGLTVLNALGFTSVPAQVGNAINFYKTEGKEGKIGFMQNKVYMPGTWTNKLFIKSQMDSEDVIMNLFNKNGAGLRNKIKREYVDATADEKGIFFRQFDSDYKALESSVDKDKNFLSKKRTETYLEMAKRVREVLEKDKTINERSPELIENLDEAIKISEKKLAREKAIVEKYHSEGQKRPDNYDPSKKYKASKAEVEAFRKTLADYEDKIESKYENR